MKRFLGMILAAVLFMVSTAMAESAVDVIMSTGTTQAFTDEAVPSEDLKRFSGQGYQQRARSISSRGSLWP